MKTETIKQMVLDNYKQLSQLAKVQEKDKNVIPTWGLIYKYNHTSGFINQIGVIERNNSTIRIINGDEIQLQKKPFYQTWKRTLKNINTMLQKTIENIDNPDIVRKKVANILCFPKDFVERLSNIKG